LGILGSAAAAVILGGLMIRVMGKKGKRKTAAEIVDE